MKKIDKNLINPSTFWDLDLLDSEKDKDFIIVRVLERSTDSEVGYIESAYSLQEIIWVLENTKWACKKTLNFYKTITL